MHKAFIFDMDGVLIDSEQIWTFYEKTFLIKLLGKEIYEKMGDMVGDNLNSVYNRAVTFGSALSKEEFIQAYDKQAAVVYQEVHLAKNTEKLIELLKQNNFAIGLVTSSRRMWVDMFLTRFLSIHFTHIVSLTDRQDLKPKPHPDGYKEMIRTLNAKPKDAIVLEDSNRGIDSAKAAGAFVIGFQQNLVPGYKQTGADVYAKNMDDVIGIVKNFLKTS